MYKKCNEPRKKIVELVIILYNYRLFLCFQVARFLTQVTTINLALTGWKLFRIDSHFLMSVSHII